MTTKTPDRLTKASNNLSLQLQRADEPKNDKKDLMRAIHEFWDAKADARESTPPAAAQSNGDAVGRAMDMLADVPGDTLDDRLTKFIGYYMAFQIEVPQLRAQLEATRKALEEIAAFRGQLGQVDNQMRQIAFAALEARGTDKPLDRAPPLRAGSEGQA